MSAQLSQFIKGFSIEVTPKGALKIERFADYLTAQTQVYITALPGSDFAATAEWSRAIIQKPAAS